MTARPIVAAICFVTLAFHVSAEELPSDFFERNVRPLLAERCFSCHGDRKQESDLRLDARGLILQGGASGDPAAIPGDASTSLIVRYTRREIEGMEMPPDDPLRPEEIEVLETWIDSGLTWPAESVAAPLTMQERAETHRKTHWAYQRPRMEPVTKAMWPRSATVWGRTRLDDFVISKLIAHGLEPSEEADRRTLLRRLSFDLLGLPPNVDEVQAFTQDRSPDAYERLVDRYLSSPSYGERWGRHWLDVARYADTSGYTFGGADRNYHDSYTYRDYVIRAFNQDLPFDQFIVQQLAADQIVVGEDNRALAALGFLTVGRKFNNRHDDIDDKIDAVSRGFLGLTVACARCHDHKYDAIPTEDYYALYGVFSSSFEPQDRPLIGDAESLKIARDYDRRISRANNALADFDNRMHIAITKHAHTQITDYLIAVVDRKESASPKTHGTLRESLINGWKKLLRRKAAEDEPTLMPWFTLKEAAAGTFADEALALAREIKGEKGEFLNPRVREAFITEPPTSRREMAERYGDVLLEAYDIWQKAGGTPSARSKQPVDVRQLLWYFSDPNSPAAIQKDRISEHLSSSEKQARQRMADEVDRVRETAPVSFHRAMVINDKEQPSDAHVLIRGNPTRKGAPVRRHSPGVIDESGRPFENGSGRLELAHDIANEHNPLTARVFVNRVWMHHFGRPLVETPSDFGVRCAEPRQRKLLDFLAAHFMQSGWSVKALHREILLSATYRQSSNDRPACYALDPENQLLWRMNRRRLEFEPLRDALLSVAGQLDRQSGGRPARLFKEPTGGKRRSVYGYIDRQDLPNLLRVFDFASPDQSVAKRANTTVSQQSLFLMNSPFVLAQARRLSDYVSERAAVNEDFVVALYHRVFARRPTTEELEIGQRFLRTAAVTKTGLSRRAQLSQLLLLTNEFCHVD